MGEPYVKVPLSILTSDLKPQSKLLFAYMLNFRNMNGNWKALCKSAKELGEALKIPATTIQRSIAELESRGLIEVQKGHVSSYLVQPTMGQDQPTMGQDQPNVGQPYTFISRIFKSSATLSNRRLHKVSGTPDICGAACLIHL